MTESNSLDPSRLRRNRRSLLTATAALVSFAIAGLGVAAPEASANVPSAGRAFDGVKLAPVLTADTAAVEPGVVRIDTTLQFQNAIGAGTGVVLSPDGIVLTNNHVIRGATDIKATNVGNGRTYTADVLGYDRKSDIAVLQLRGASDLPVAPTTGSSSVRIGDLVTAVGYPDGGDLARAPGTVRALEANIFANDELTGSAEELSNLVDFDADIRPGDSGGPLVDPSGRVVGIVTAASQTYQMKSAGGFAIPLDRALPIADAIRSGNASGSVHVGPTAILGVGVGSVRDEAGVPIRGVLRGSAADQAGVMGGDVITAIDGMPTVDGTVLTDVLDGHLVGDVVTLSLVDRQGTLRNVPVTLAAGPPN